MKSLPQTENCRFDVEVEDLSAMTPQGEPKLRNVSLRIDQGEYVALRGPSGAGKTLLAAALAGIRANSLRYDGSVKYIITPEQEASTVLPKDTNVRERYIGFVPQDSDLDPDMTALDNIYTPTRLKKSVGVNKDVLGVTINQLRLYGILNSKAKNLSGGERQRVAIARALAHGPNAVILDEPTSELDKKLKGETNQMLSQLVAALGITVLAVTHEETNANRWIELVDGAIVADSIVKKGIITPRTAQNY